MDGTNPATACDGQTGRSTCDSAVPGWIIRFDNRQPRIEIASESPVTITSVVLYWMQGQGVDLRQPDRCPTASGEYGGRWRSTSRTTRLPPTASTSCIRQPPSIARSCESISQRSTEKRSAYTNGTSNRLEKRIRQYANRLRGSGGGCDLHSSAPIRNKGAAAGFLLRKFSFRQHDLLTIYLCCSRSRSDRTISAQLCRCKTHRPSPAAGQNHRAAIPRYSAYASRKYPQDATTAASGRLERTSGYAPTEAMIREGTGRALDSPDRIRQAAVRSELPLADNLCSCLPQTEIPHQDDSTERNDVGISPLPSVICPHAWRK